MLKTEAIEQGMLNTPYMWVIYKLLVSQKSQHKMFLGHSALQGWLWFSCHELWYKILAHISEKSNLGSFHFHWKFYRVSGVHQKSSDKRSSKVAYLTDNGSNIARRISKRIETLTGLSILNGRNGNIINSENFQVLNPFHHI